jgi:hypothetical protein
VINESLRTSANDRLRQSYYGAQFPASIKVDERTGEPHPLPPLRKQRGGKGGCCCGQVYRSAIGHDAIYGVNQLGQVAHLVDPAADGRVLVHVAVTD